MRFSHATTVKQSNVPRFTYFTQYIPMQRVMGMSFSEIRAAFSTAWHDLNALRMGHAPTWEGEGWKNFLPRYVRKVLTAS